LTQDEIWVRAWAQVREPLELQLALPGRRRARLDCGAARGGILDTGRGGGEAALDICSGSRPNGTVVGIDLSAGVLAFAWRATERCQQVRFLQADAQVYPFKPASFDAVMDAAPFVQIGVPPDTAPSRTTVVVSVAGRTVTADLATKSVRKPVKALREHSLHARSAGGLGR
jgi:ubiquinone/menaquinone biosynthesis C-methylase UbiE